MLAFAKYSHALNGLFEINETARPKTVEDEDEEVEGEEEEEEEEDDDEDVVA